MPERQDPWVEVEREMEALLEQLNSARAAFMSKSAAPTSSGDAPAPHGGLPSAANATPKREPSVRAAMSVEADELLSGAEQVEELLGDARLAVDMAINHPERFSIATIEMQRRRDLIRQWERRSEEARADARLLGQQRAAVSAAGPSHAGSGSRGAARGEGEENAHTDFIDGELTQQQRHVQEQDEGIDRLREGVSRVKTKAVMIGDELRDQEVMLDEVDKDMSVVQVKIESVAKRVGKLLDESSDRNKMICILVLIIILGVLIVLMFAED